MGSTSAHRGTLTGNGPIAPRLVSPQVTAALTVRPICYPASSAWALA